MYKSLYEIWEKEVKNLELQRLPSDFYVAVAYYLRMLREEGRMLDRKTVKASLLKRELTNVKRMVSELVLARYRKVIKILMKGEKIPQNVLTAEETNIYGGVAPFADVIKNFTKNVLCGFLPKADVEPAHKRVALRFLADVPAVIGADMKTYGPFKVEDVASLPIENANILVKQGLAEKVELRACS
ncbi:MAG: DNA replication complex subunit Gins51 [Candidatus Bathycorpusculaceae bacterium]